MGVCCSSVNYTYTTFQGFNDNVYSQFLKSFQEQHDSGDFSLLGNFKIFNEFLRLQQRANPIEIGIIKWEICFALITRTKMIGTQQEWINFISNQQDYQEALDLFKDQEFQKNNQEETHPNWQLLISQFNLIMMNLEQSNLQYNLFEQTYAYLQDQIVELQV
ncbi:unnamed protein product [Paramecium sonneborni]|uniref:Uncharacterized protein n=1 Tax=Paramecium sonneborni TaxID=65129 RepID=A0A8S1RL51_9CILI|nr:unnamed protein product [Paramecium sonneborni]CAD8127871.1 unnamed protein product [Paramecium sonneborni]